MGITAEMARMKAAPFILLSVAARCFKSDASLRPKRRTRTSSRI